MNRDFFFELNDIFFDKFDKYLLYFETLIEFYSIYDGYPLELNIKKDDNILKSIYANILLKYKSLHEIIDSEYMFTCKETALLERIAIGDRRAYTAIKKERISQITGNQCYHKLENIGILQKELSREKPIITLKHLPKKKEYRGYQIEHKFKFNSSFLRFWFNFIEPNIKLLEKDEYDKVLEKISRHFESFVSFTFEELSQELIKNEYGNVVLEIGSYWDKNIEIDLLCKLTGYTTIAGECKWKNHKVSKNVLNTLVSKCNTSLLRANKYALFSKRGFSKELQNLKDKNILLYDLRSFKGLLDDK
jgi:hypothetical protein